MGGSPLHRGSAILARWARQRPRASQVQAVRHEDSHVFRESSMMAPQLVHSLDSEKSNSTKSSRCTLLVGVGHSWAPCRPETSHGVAVAFDEGRHGEGCVAGPLTPELQAQVNQLLSSVVVD